MEMSTLWLALRLSLSLLDCGISLCPEDYDVVLPRPEKKAKGTTTVFG